MRNVTFLFLLLFLTGCGSQKISNYEAKSTLIDSLKPEGDLNSIINPYRLAMESEMNEVIGHSVITLEKSAGESALGNFASEATYIAGIEFARKVNELPADLVNRSFVLLNNGGLRAPINKGEITVGNIYELMPFDNTLVLIRIKAEQMRNCVAYLEEHQGQPIYNAVFDFTQEPVAAMIAGEPYLFDKDVLIFTSDYLAGGGDKMDFFANPVFSFDSGRFLRDIFLDYVKAQQTLSEYPMTGKFKFKSR